MKRIKYASIIFVIGAILYVSYTTYSDLAEKHCWHCSREVLFERGTGLIFEDDNESKERGIKFIESAARQGHIEAQIFLGELYMGSLPALYYIHNKDRIAAVRANVPADEQKGISYFKQLTESLSSVQGDYVRMQYNLGVLFANGILESSDSREDAKAWFLRSAKGGDIDAMYEAGMCYNDTGDYTTARQWFTDAFEKGGECRSAIMIGDYYFYAKGLIKDYGQSIVWYGNALSAVSDSKPVYSDKVKKRWSQSASNRLKIAQKKAAERPGKEVVTLTYGLKGGVRAYSIYTPDINGILVGNVRNENGKIEASVKQGDSSSGPGISNVASMNEGLYWVLNRYAENKYGTDKRFGFVLKK